MDSTLQMHAITAKYHTHTKPTKSTCVTCNSNNAKECTALQAAAPWLKEWCSSQSATSPSALVHDRQDRHGVCMSTGARWVGSAWRLHQHCCMMGRVCVATNLRQGARCRSGPVTWSPLVQGCTGQTEPCVNQGGKASGDGRGQEEAHTNPFSQAKLSQLPSTPSQTCNCEVKHFPLP